MTRAQTEAPDRREGAGGDGRHPGGGRGARNERPSSGLVRDTRSALRWLAPVLLGALLAWVLVPAAGSPVGAHSDEEIERLKRQIQQFENRQKELQQDRRATKQRIRDLKQRERGLEATLAALSHDLRHAREELALLRARLDAEERRLQRATEELADARRRLRRRTELLKRRVRAMADYGTVGYLEVLLDSQSFSDFLTRFQLLQRIARHDAALMRRVQAERRALEDKKREIETTRARVQALRDSWVTAKEKVEVKAAQKRDVLAQVEQDRSEYEAALDRMEAASRQIEQELRDMQAELARLMPDYTGDFIWPVDRTGYWRVSSPYGRRWHPILGRYRFHDGVDIAKRAGSNVYAVAPGRVVYAGWYGGYGNTVIVAHDDRVSTLYAHNATLLIGVGQRVQQRQVIARVGSTGFSTGPHLHFEVRVNGKPVDPKQYLGP